jgi:hypothetical protein
MSNDKNEIAYLTRNCVIKPGKDGFKGDKIEKDIVGEQVWEDLALAGALSKAAPVVKPETKKDSKTK